MGNGSRRQKRRRKIAQNPRSVRFEDLRRLLEDYDFEFKRTRGSHHTFVGYVNDTKLVIVIPFKRPLKSIYVKKVLAILDEIEPLEEDEKSNDE